MILVVMVLGGKKISVFYFEETEIWSDRFSFLIGISIPIIIPAISDERFVLVGQVIGQRV